MICRVLYLVNLSLSLKEVNAIDFQLYLIWWRQTNQVKTRQRRLSNRSSKAHSRNPTSTTWLRINSQASLSFKLQKSSMKKSKRLTKILSELWMVLLNLMTPLSYTTKRVDFISNNRVSFHVSHQYFFFHIEKALWFGAHQ